MSSIEVAVTTAVRSGNSAPIAAAISHPYGAKQNLLRLTSSFWRNATVLCCRKSELVTVACFSFLLTIVLFQEFDALG